MEFKLDWQPEDYIVYEKDGSYFNEFMRIRNNILEIYDIVVQLNPNIVLQSMPEYTSYADNPHLIMYQSIENNVEILNKDTFNFEYTKKVFPDFSSTVTAIKTWDYNDLNRIENILFNIYETLQQIATSVHILSENNSYITTEDSNQIKTEGN